MQVSKSDVAAPPGEAEAVPDSPVAAAFAEYAEVLLQAAQRILHRKERAEDIVQESFRLAYEAEKTTPIEHPKSYLFITARRLAIRENTRISEKLTGYMEDSGVSDISSEEPSAYDRLAAEERRQLMSDAIASLPPQCRKVLLLRMQHGMSHKQIAAELGISTSTIEKHLAKAIRSCRDFIRNAETDT